jgi:ParB family transcriptional regulator, chromosome partitioning protein
MLDRKPPRRRTSSVSLAKPSSNAATSAAFLFSSLKEAQMAKQTANESSTVLMRIDDVRVFDRKRGIDAANVDRLAKSIASIGLLNPIVVRSVKVAPFGRSGHVGTCVLVAGLHRLEAVKRLGLEFVECRVVSDDDLQAELMEIDENLCRADLTPAQEAAYVTRRKEIYLALHPATGAGKSQAAGLNAKLGRGNVSDNLSVTFTEATAAVSGKHRRTVERAAARGRAIKLENIDKIVGTSLDKGTELDALVELPEKARKELIGRAAKGEDLSARAALQAAKATTAQEFGPSGIKGVSARDEEAQFRSLEMAWNAASNLVRGRFAVEVLHLGSVAWGLPKREKRPSGDQAAA